jgi:hypothetical protein
MIKLKENKNAKTLMEEYNYSKEDLLNKEDVAMYQFEHCVKGKSRLKELECNKYGYVVPTFNETISGLVDEVYAFQED